MAQSSNHQQHGNRSRNRNRSRSRNRSRDNRGSSSGGGSQRRFVKQKVPRRTGKPSIWERICSWLGLGPKRPKPPQRASKKGTQNRTKSTPKKQPRGRERQSSTPRNTGPPEKVAVTSSRLYVGNLPYSTTGDELETLFETVGKVVRAEIVYHRRSNRSKGYAFVEMSDTNDARKAAETLHDHELMERKIIVNGAKSAGPEDNQSS